MVDKRATKSKSSDARRLRVKVKLYDNNNKVIASDGDELEAGILDSQTVAWLLSEGKAEWVEGEK